MFNDNWCGSENVIYIHSMVGVPSIIRQYHLDIVVEHNFVPAVKIGEMFTPWSKA